MSNSMPADDPGRGLTLSAPDGPQMRHVGQAGSIYTLLISGSQTAGRYCLIDMIVPPGAGPPPHRHGFEEMFVLLDGELQFTFRGDTKVVRAPMSVNVPANAPHRFHNGSGETARMLCMCTPAGLDVFLSLIGTPLPDRRSFPPQLDEADEARKDLIVQELAARFRIEVV